MKRTRILIFVICFALIFVGMFSIEFWGKIGVSAVNFVKNIPEQGMADAFGTLTDDLERITSWKLSYHGIFMDINSLTLRLTNTNVVEKEDITVVRTGEGTLANPRPYMPDEALSRRADSVKRLSDAAEKSGTKFLYVMAPTKGYSLSYPEDVGDSTKSNCDRFLSELKGREVETLNLIETMADVPEEELFFTTDHHWRPEYAFRGAWEIADCLKDRYGFTYDQSLSDINNYNVNVLKDWFLGSQGKKTGKFFAKGGADDISIIIPKFDTALKEEQPAKGTFREGTFEETVMFMENVERKDYYNLNPYVAYSGGDFREQIITNKLNPEGKTILLVRDSFSCAMSPFLSLAASRINCIDVRDGGYVGVKPDVYAYIEALRPDYLVVMYTGMSAGEDLYDFD